MSDQESTGQVAPAVTSEAQPAATTENVETQQVDTEAAAGEQTQVEERKFSQAELDSIIQKEKAKAEAKAERKALKAYQETLERFAPKQEPQRQEDYKPSRAQYANEEQFIDALTDWKLEQRERQVNQSKQLDFAKNMAAKTENRYAEAAKLPGVDRDDFEALPRSKAMAESIIESDIAPKLMAYMSSNPADVERISGLSPARQAVGIGKLEMKISSTPVKTTKAPAPINPVSGNGTASPTSIQSVKSVDQMKELLRKNGSRWVR